MVNALPEFATAETTLHAHAVAITWSRVGARIALDLPAEADHRAYTAAGIGLLDCMADTDVGAADRDDAMYRCIARGERVVGVVHRLARHVHRTHTALLAERAEALDAFYAPGDCGLCGGTGGGTDPDRPCSACGGSGSARDSVLSTPIFDCEAA